MNTKDAFNLNRNEVIMLLGKNQTLLSIMLEPIGLIHIIIPTDALHNMGHKKCTANKVLFIQMEKKIIGSKKNKLNIKRS